MFPVVTMRRSSTAWQIVSAGNYAHFTRLESVSKATDYYLGQRLDHPAMPRQAELKTTGSTCNSLVINIPPPGIPLHAMSPAPLASLRINNSDVQDFCPYSFLSLQPNAKLRDFLRIFQSNFVTLPLKAISSEKDHLKNDITAFLSVFNLKTPL